jgi:hypothetical protein
MNQAELIRSIYMQARRPFGSPAGELDGLINEIAKRVAKLIRPPEDGKPGHTPTAREITALIKPLIPKPIKGDNGVTPTAAEITALIVPLIPKAIKPADGHTPTKKELTALITPIVYDAVTIAAIEQVRKLVPKMIADAIKEIPPAQTITLDQIKGVAEPIIRSMMAEAKKGWFGGGGGGDLTDAGYGIIMTRNAVGRKIYSVDPSIIPEGGGVGPWQTPSEEPAADGSTLIFTVGSDAPTDVIRDGIAVFEDIHWTFDSGSEQITFIDNGPTQYVRYR